MKLLGYVRVSTAEQAFDGVSLGDQEARLRAWCAALGHELLDVVSDPGVSGTIPLLERAGWKRLRGVLDDASAHVQGVVAVALDRFSRDAREILAMIATADSAGWSVLSLRESLDTSTAVGRFVVTILAALAQMERDLISERTTSAMRRLRETGKRFSRIAPWGTRFLDGRPSENSVEVAIAMHVRGRTDHPAALVAADLQDLFGNHPRSGSTWRREDVHGLRRALRRGSKPRARP